ncbi:hypothetical protein L7F22_039303 [Adiantum nelumboides]|nr:hypothetical protein [Adiantum nelumboides]
MDGLLGIGKEKRAVNGILHNAARQRKGLVEEIEDGIVPVNRADEEDGRQTQSIQPLRNSGLICAICRIESSPYTCPQCNIPYCSVKCFRDRKHERCSKPFVQQALEEERKANEEDGDKEGAFVDEEEREKMMDVLRRLQKLDTNIKQASSQTRKPQLHNSRLATKSSDVDNHEFETGEEEEEEEEGSDWEDILQTAEKAGIDLDTADTQELLAMLSAEEREHFQTMIQQADLNGGRITASSELISKKEGEDRNTTSTKWWNLSDIDRTEKRPPEVSVKFSKDVEAIIKGMQSRPLGNELQWNILLVSLSYVYILRHANIDNLAVIVRKKVEDQYELDFVRKLFCRLVPFLITGQPLDKKNDSSRTLLSNAEDVTLWLLAKLGSDAGERPAEIMQFLFKELQQPFLSTSKVRLENDNNSRMMSLLNDIYCIASKADRKKIASMRRTGNNLSILMLMKVLSRRSRWSSIDLKQKSSESKTRSDGELLMKLSKSMEA